MAVRRFLVPSLPSLGVAVAGVALAAALLVSSEWDAVLMVAGAVACSASLVVAALTWTRVTVGVDGVHLRRGWRSRVVRWSEVNWIDMGDTLRIWLLDGSYVDVDAYIRAVRRVHAALRDGLTAARASLAGESASVLDAVLRREGVRGLRRLAAGGASHREATIGPDRLLAFVESGTGSPLQRAAAAVALAGTTDETTRERLRRAAGGTVEPRVRVAIEAAAAETPDAQLEAVLDDLEQDLKACR